MNQMSLQKESGEIMLFGVRVKVDPMRKSVSMNNLSQYQQLPNDSPPSKTVAEEDSATGYASADDAVALTHQNHHNSSGRERKRGVPWTEEEHKLFLLGLQKVGKGDWRGISRNFVKTRTPTQVASHAQKYFLRRNNLNRRRRRSSLFDITTDSVTEMPMEEIKSPQDNSNALALSPSSMSKPEISSVTSDVGSYPVVQFPVTFAPVEQVNNSPIVFLHPVPVVPTSSSSAIVDLNLNQSSLIVPASIPSAMVDLNLNQSSPIEPAELSLGLSLAWDQSQSSARFQVMPSFNNGENIIRVA